MKRRACIRIPSENTGVPLLDFLCRRFTYHDRSAWEDLIRHGRVLVNGDTAFPPQTLSAGDQLEYIHSSPPEPPVAEDYSILFEDHTLLVVNKPGNLPCHPGGRYFAHTLWGLLKSNYPEDSIFFVNRIDRETSGIVLIAKTRDAAINCQKQFLAGAVRKRYGVIVEGDFPKGIIHADGYLQRDQESLIRKKQRFFYPHELKILPTTAKICSTSFLLIQQYDGKSLVAAKPVTGRLHQIRATLLSLGYPVTGDKIYGVDETLFLRFIEDGLTDLDRRRLCLSRQALHAEFLELNHPASGKRIQFFSHLPEDMAGFFDVQND